MPFLWLGVDDPRGQESKRGLIERQAISLLSNYVPSTFDAPSEGWLGRHHPEGKVRLSGLWNIKYVDRPYIPEFLNVMDSWVGRA